MEFYTNVARYGSNILYRGYKDGSLVEKKVKYCPVLYEKTSKETEFRDIYGTPVAPKEFPSMREARDYIGMMKDVDNHAIYGYDNFISQFIQEAYPKTIEWDYDKISIVTFDIECLSSEGFPEPDEAKYPITTVSLKNSKSRIYHAWGMKELDTSDKTLVPEGYLLKYHYYQNEEDLLLSLINYFEENRPDVLSGYNITTFDIPYIINRIIRLLGEEYARRLSPWKIVRETKIKTRFGNEVQGYQIYGISTLDFMEVFMKFGFTYGPQESYTLNNIASVVLGEEKVSYDDHESLDALYRDDFQTFMRYNIRDVSLVIEMEDITSFTQLAMTIAYMGGVNYEEALGTVNVWETIIYRHLMLQKIVFPPRRNVDFAGKYEGAFVRDPMIGKHKWIVSFDLNSLYPLTISTYNIGPETLLKNQTKYPLNREFWLDPDLDLSEHKGKGYSIAANNRLFRNDEQSFLGNLMEKFYSDRDKIKRDMITKKQELETVRGDKALAHKIEDEANVLDNTQHAIKILLNSVYGAIGMRYFYFYDVALAEAITKSGQVARGWAENEVNAYINRIMDTEGVDYGIMGDTDSVYFTFDALVEKFKPKDPVKFIDKICEEKIEPLLEKAFETLMARQNCYKNLMAMKREVIADVGIIQAKKRYILNVLNSEGVQYAEPDLKVMGVEAVKSSTPRILKEHFENVFQILLFGTEQDLHKYILNLEKEFRTLPAKDVSFPRGVSDIEKWVVKEGFMKRTPIHVRGSLVFNRLLDKHKLPLERIKNGNKVKFTYLREPNHTMANVISFKNDLPPEFDLERYIDYDLQFEKSFEGPVQMFTRLIGWTTREVNTIESLFV